MTGLHIAEGLALPVEAVTEPIGLFANRGKGKSNAAHRFVEQLYHAGLPSIVLDVKGDWYGIRSSADGTKAGLPFLILGGTYGDTVLEQGSGQQWARFLAEQRVPTIVDLSHFSKTQARKWVMEFAEELYRVNTDPLMLVVDEADVVIPQRLAAELMRLLGAMEDIAKRGRQRGLGITVISQRVADVNKSVTDLLETLFLFAVTGTRTRKALLDWIDDHADPDEAKAVVATLSSLEPGECWVWSPGWLRLLRRVRVLRPETFDSHATPAPGQQRKPIKTMADVDLAAIKEQMAETIERAKADDPKELHKRIADLERQLRDAEARPDPEPVVEVERVEVPVLDEQLVVRLEEALSPATGLLAEVQERLAWEVTQRDEVLEFERRLRDRQDAPHAPAVRAPQRPDPPARREPRRAPVPRPAGGGGVTDLPKAERAFLTVLAQYPAGGTRDQVAIFAGYSVKSRHIDNTLAALRSAGYIAGGRDNIVITDAGLAALGEWEPLPTGSALVDHFKARFLGKAESLFLDVVLDVYPETITRDEVAERAGYSVQSRHVDNTLARLRSLQLITGGRDAIRAADVLVDEYGSRHG